ncbi:MAG: hypothetical protein MJ179_02515 [Treponema sp.]|nr:hypothetical protein [Treponema sp.]
MNKQIREILKDQIRTAKAMADAEILKNPDDNGTCNFDRCLFKKESKWTYNEMSELFKECELNCSKHSAGWLSVDEIKGQAEKNTRWHKTFKYWLEEQGFECSMYYQMD